MKRLAFALAISAALALPAGALAHGRQAAPAPTPSIVVQWNQTLLSILNTPGQQPATVHPTRSMAIVHLAIFDAVADAGRGPRLHWRRHPSRAAAADAAAHAALVALFPGEQGMLDAQYASLLAQVPDAPRKAAGVRIGEHAAAELLAERANDGANVTPPVYVPGDQPGDYQLTPPNFAPAVFTHWANVTPFVLRRASQFRPPPPPPLTSRAYADAINEVKALGIAGATSTRTPDQTQIGQFWGPPIQNFWNQIAETVSIQHHDTLRQDAALFAALDVTLADTAIAFYDAKYAYRFWRPITAIREAQTDGNPLTTADPMWLPLAGNTAPDPSYPGAHSTVSGAAGIVLAAFFGDRDHFSVTSTALPGVTRSFDSFSAAVGEAGLSRTYAGQHTRLDDVAGRELGRDVAVFDLHHWLGWGRPQG